MMQELQDQEQLHEQEHTDVVAAILDDTAEALRAELQQFGEEEQSDDSSRTSKRGTYATGDRSRAKRPRTRNDLMHVAQQLVSACLPMAGRVPSAAEGTIPQLFDLSALPFSIPHANYTQQGMISGSSSSSSSGSTVAGGMVAGGNFHGAARALHAIGHSAPVGTLPGLAPGQDLGQQVQAAAPATDDRKHECELCGKRYKHRTHLTRHLRTHTGEKPFGCNICGKTFARREYLNMHMTVHQGQTSSDVKFLQCKHCDKKFTRQQVLDKHMEFHSPARRFACQTCGLRFKTGSGLAAHVTAHTANRPHVCSVCSKGFKSSTALKAHEVVHTGERKFACSECDKTFNNLSSLQKHMLIHSEDNPYKCEMCDQTFKYSSNFTRHLRQHLQSSTS